MIYLIIGFCGTTALALLAWALCAASARAEAQQARLDEDAAYAAWQRAQRAEPTVTGPRTYKYSIRIKDRDDGDAA